MDTNLVNSVLAMDAYNRGYGAGISLTGTSLGNAVVIKDSNDLKDENGVRLDQPAGFYAVAYQVGEGPTAEHFISYRGTDTFSNDPIAGGGDFTNGFGTGAGYAGTPQATLAVDFYKAVAVGVSASRLCRSDIRYLPIRIGGYRLSADLRRGR